MFQLRQELVDAFDRAAYQRFAKETIDELREVYPAEMARLTPEQALQLVASASNQASAYGLESQYAVSGLAEIWLLLGHEPAGDPRCHHLLLEGDADENERVDLARAHVWDLVAEREASIQLVRDDREDEDHG